MACQGEAFNEEKNDADVEYAIVETGELSAVQTKAFVLPRFGRFGSFRIIDSSWIAVSIIGEDAGESR